MLRHLLCATLSATALAFLPAAMHAESLVVAENILQSGWNVGGVDNQYGWGQTFTMSETGTLEQIWIFASRNGDTPIDGNLVVRFYGYEQGALGAELGSATLNLTTIEYLPKLLPADFTGANLQLQAGQQYAWTLLGTTGTGFSIQPFRDDDPYAGGVGLVTSNSGAAWSEASARDFGFQVTANVVPEPTSAALALGALGATALLRRRRR